MRGIASFIAGFGNGYFKAEDKKYERERQQKLDAQANELHTAKMSEIIEGQAERQRERDFREANAAALSAGKTDTGQVVTDAAGSNAYTKDADAAAVLQDMAQTANGGAQVAPATRVLTGVQGATQRGTIPGQQVFTDPAKAQEFAQSMPMSEYAKMQARKTIAEQYGKLDIADDMRSKLETLASKGVFKASSLLDAGNADGALKVLQDMNPDLVPKGAQFKQVDVPDMFDHSKTAKGWALVAPGAEGQPERVLVGDFRDAVFGYLTPQERMAQDHKVRELQLKQRELEEVKIPNAETQRELLSIKTALAQMRGGGGGGGSDGRGVTTTGLNMDAIDKHLAPLFAVDDPVTGKKSINAQGMLAVRNLAMAMPSAANGDATGAAMEAYNAYTVALAKAGGDTQKAVALLQQAMNPAPAAAPTAPAASGQKSAAPPPAPAPATRAPAPAYEPPADSPAGRAKAAREAAREAAAAMSMAKVTAAAGAAQAAIASKDPAAAQAVQDMPGFVSLPANQKAEIRSIVFGR